MQRNNWRPVTHFTVAPNICMFSGHCESGLFIFFYLAGPPHHHSHLLFRSEPSIKGKARKERIKFLFKQLMCKTNKNGPIVKITAAVFVVIHILSLELPPCINSFQPLDVTSLPGCMMAIFFQFIILSNTYEPRLS